MLGRVQMNKQQQFQLLQKLLKQQGLQLLEDTQIQNKSLLSILANSIHADNISLHSKICEKLSNDASNNNLPRKLQYIYSNMEILNDFKKYPQMINFAKIILQMFSASAQRRINIYSLTRISTGLTLSCRIINQAGYIQSINIAKLDKSYYNVKQRHIQSKNQLSLDQIFKTNSQVNSDSLAQPFKSEVAVVQACSSIQLIQQIAEQQKLKELQSEPIPHLQPKTTSMQKLQKQESNLINECVSSNNINENNNFYPTHLMASMLTAQQLMYYYPNYYTHKQQQMYTSYQSMHTLPCSSPSKNIYKSPNDQNSYTYNQSNYGQTATLQTNQNNRYYGRLKFFDQHKSYGFIIMQADSSDIFVHYDDLQKAGISKDLIKSYKNQFYLRFNFKVMQYFGKYKKSRKAVDLIIVDDNTNPTSYPLPE